MNNIARLLSLLVLIGGVFLSGISHAEDEYWEYTFRPGDTIWNIAKEHTNSVNNWTEIRELNRIYEGPDRRILPGTRIKIPVSMLKQQPTPATVIAVSGAVLLIRNNGEQEGVKVGTQLFSGDRLQTQKQQSVRLQFADQSELQIFSQSEVVLDKISHHQDTGMVDTRVRLNKGRVKTWVEKLKQDSNYEIKTPAAITAVRGTQFRMSSDENQISRTEVTEGLVSVAAGNDIRQLKDGFGIVAEIGKPLPEPVKLLEAPTIIQLKVSRTKTVKLSWAALTGAQTYRYQVARDKRFRQLLLDRATTENSAELTGLEPGRHFVRLRGIDELKLEGQDAVGQFEIVKAPEGNDWEVIMTIGAGLLLM
ncbi:MAG: FecR domain-containing protein [Gammaproteobacteria bacterium]|nr:FecR domain-containing protein [Gammaproteobacteria bacterium]